MVAPQPSPFLAMGLVAVPCLLLMSLARNEKLKGQAFLFFMWSILSTPLNIGVHVAAAFASFPTPPLLGAAFILLSGLAFQIFVLRRGPRAAGRADLAAYALLGAPLAFIFLAYGWKKQDRFLLIQGLIFCALGAVMALHSALSKSGQKKFERALDFLNLRLRLVFLAAVALLIADNLLVWFSSWDRLAVFWGFIAALSAAALSAFLAPQAAIESLSAKLPAFSIGFGFRRGGSRGSSGGPSGGGGASGKW